MEQVKLESVVRTATGSQESRRLRRQGMLPAVLYGHGAATLHLAVPQEGVETVLRHHGHVVEISAEGWTETAFIKDVQYDPLGEQLLHVDFARVALDEKVTLEVPIVLRGQPKGVGPDAQLVQESHELEVECLATAIPESIAVQVRDLEVGQAIHVRDLVLPEGVVAITPGDAVVVHVERRREEEEVEGEVAAPGPSEPEVISRKAEAGEGEKDEG